MLRPTPVGSCSRALVGSSLPPPLRSRQGFHFEQRMMYTQCCVASSKLTRNSFRPPPPPPTTTTTIPHRTLATTASRKRRRPKNISKMLPSSSTTKDRMRHLVETNQLAPAPPMAQQLNEMLDVATGRLTWLRDTMFRTWNPDYNSSGSPSQQQQLQLESSESPLPKQEAKRPPWRPTEMDARWWFWNLVWALFPAAFIGLYCEFRGKPRMLAYQRQRELEELEQILGKEVAAEVMLEKLEGASAASIVDESFWERMSRIRQELSIWWRGGININTNEEKELLEATHVKEHTPVKDLSKSSQQTREAPQPKPLPTKTAVVTEKPSPQQAEVTTTNTAPAIPAMLQQQQHELLLQRIEQLEAMVQRQEEQRQRELERQLDRLRSSGIRNRAMEGRGGASVVQTGHKAGLHDKKISPDEENQSKKEALSSMSRLVWDNISAMVENVQSMIQSNVAHEKPEETTSSDTKEPVDKTANTPEPTKNDSQHKESSTASPLPEEKKEVDVENVEKRPWWKPW